ncbi:MAG: sodium-translocating pyrophosphatase [Patescibacteria group bacterium]|nr:sodium-translocating pyrophosphatase [Patescibacteria group bacterium]MDD4304665.1 sodium-translocating pyrophosphatase [Patescibacteria group bacterium]MDD4695694.1 sodium-translocating pyrophosphatase [Patescibacteria group bacterium]
MTLSLIFALSTAFVAIIYTLITSYIIIKKDQGNENVKEIAQAIYHGSMTFLKKEYKVLIVFIIIIAILLSIGMNKWQVGLAFIIGSFTSALAGNIGMRIATKANSRTAVACQTNIGHALKIAFSSGSVMGLSVVGFGLLGITSIFLIEGSVINEMSSNILFCFGFGASFVALFARVGGGIYTKAADVGADLVGKVEEGIPEDDIRNPATIADNVGDNVGDVAGMGADLFESYVQSIIAAIIIGATTIRTTYGITLPLLLAGIGIISSILGTFLVRTNNKKNIQSALNNGVFGSGIIMIILSYFLITGTGNDIRIFYSTVIGLISGVLIGLSTEYFTSDKRLPVRSIAESSKTGVATNIIHGLSVGMLSTIAPVIIISITIISTYKLMGLYGIAIAAVGMLSTLGITLATDSYGPVADNAAGIAQMAHMGEDVREKAESLDAVGNVTAAVGKGFAIGSAGLTALALFSSFTQIIGQKGFDTVINITEPNIIVGLFIGALLPFVFSSLTISAVGRAAFKMVEEIRRQFKEMPGIIEGTIKADYDKCIAISTDSALKEMILPSVLAIIIPFIVGFTLGVQSLGGLIAGSTVCGFLMAIFMSNSGGAWDNAKKYIEAGNFGGKGSFAHKAAIMGDTVGDPFKDTAGPSLNILIKLVSIVSLLFVMIFL